MSTAAIPTSTIVLTPEEERVRKLLVDVAAEIDAGRAEHDEPLILRFTGGWVRDKLIGQQSHDIDVGINKMTGFDFATRMQEFLTEHNDAYDIPTRNIHKVESNPEKSKHLETATTKILSLDIDFVNLRSETYSEDSRIPQMEFGTPVQDALRRDACINALFYNIHTQQIEDFTERGLEDIKNKVIRTPLPPFQTFNDDPLRVLRLLRFSSRLNFEIVDEAKEAMRDPEIKKALRMKISRERIGVEIEKMLQGPNPYRALTLMDSLTLFDAIFTPPIDALPTLPVENLSLATAVLQHILTSPDCTNLQSLAVDKHDQYVAWLLASFSPWAGHLFPGVDTRKNIPAAATAAREGLRMMTKINNIIISSYRNYSMIQEVVQKVGLSRSQVGMFIRELGAEWRSQYLCALMLEAIPYWKEGGPDRTQEVLVKYSTFLSQIKDMDLEEAHAFKTVLNGKQLMSALGQEKSGPWLMGALNRLMEWQLENPEKDSESAIEWIKENKEKLLST
ncbi:hypothetical protein BZA05DRAFT_337958 [Tricharina praecox]|uniref:uncharacterized protein n=1 Tax=Tricharina praecox TaxID=43433 RepID=UPI00221F4610|nr:uncharacterized protein BZA05DRAFT_337958 [Tricharina praecox]KAI5850992.1 hypothetical protein BZA05DRAFT_337958 [Tricharina praecox]